MGRWSDGHAEPFDTAQDKLCRSTCNLISEKLYYIVGNRHSDELSIPKCLLKLLIMQTSPI